MNKLKLKSALETPAPIPCRVLSMEIESYHRKIAEIENKNFAREDLAIYRAEILLRIDLYRLSSGEAYERIADVAKGDKSAAIKLFHDLNGHGWKDKFGWIGQSKTTVRPEIPMFEAEGGLFDGIQSSERRISGITLTNNGCEGQLSDRIGDFAALNTLYLDCNNIEGKIPRGLGRLELLEYFNLSGNQLVGELDQRSLTKLTTLRILNLSFNGLSGELPDCFDSITKLQELNLSGNKFHGPLPNSMSTCVNIRHLQLYSNQFSGRVPDWLSNLTNLVSINLSQNQFTGGINQLFTCRKLKKIQFTSNKLTTPLDSSISNLTSLSLLYLHHNAITGPIPSSLCSLHSLQFLNLSYNSLSGTLPELFGNLYQLRVCILSQNHLTGPLPKSITKLSHLVDFHVFTALPCETMSLDRGFLPQKFQRIHNWSMEVGIDSVHWEEPTEEELEEYNVFGSHGGDGGKGEEGKTKTGKKKKKKTGNQLRFRDLDGEEGIQEVIERLRKQSEEGIELEEEG